MKHAFLSILLATAVAVSAAETKPAATTPPKPGAKPAATPPKKPAPKPAAKPKPATAKPSPKQPSIKDLALADARKCDASGNGKLEGSEVSAVRGVFAKNPNSYLYIFDDNSNKMLDDAEIAKIEFAPRPKPATPKPGAKPAPAKKPAPPKKK